MANDTQVQGTNTVAAADCCSLTMRTNDPRRAVESPASGIPICRWLPEGLRPTLTRKPTHQRKRNAALGYRAGGDWEHPAKPAAPCPDTIFRHLAGLR